uniref:Silenced mating-type M-specific polypeptide Mc n=1 Tax=Anthurium amnicola TaxID=1678845 RepID=A0A1D1YTU4_9ARAE
MSGEKSQQGSFSVFKSGVVCNNNLVPYDFNEEVICFGDSLSFEDIIYNSRIRDTLNLSVEVLTNDSQKTRLAARNKRPGAKRRIPRPQNAFMIYRRDKFASPEFLGVKSSVASVKIAKMWREEDNEVIRYFNALAILASKNHSKKYQGYQYQPRSKKSNRQVKQLKNDENILPEMISSPITVYHVQLSVTPSSPINEYPTPATSINDYFLTPPSSLSQNSPITPQLPINGYLLTPASSIEYSPVVSSEDSNELVDIDRLFPHLRDITPLDILNEDFERNPDEDLLNFLSGAESLTTTNVFESQPEIQPTLPNFFSGTEPLFTTEPQPEIIQPTLDETQLSNFFSGTESLSTTELQPKIQPFDFDFDFSTFQPECEPMDAPLETPATNVEHNTLFLDPSEWRINNDTTIHPEQMDYVHGYNTVNGWPSL